jgi:hypothetical protein
MQSVSITTDVVSSNLEQGEMYNIKEKSLSVTCARSVVFSRPPVSSTNKTDRHDIAEILLKVTLNTIKLTKPNNRNSNWQSIIWNPETLATFGINYKTETH